MNINDALISSAITSGIYILYKGINHYRIHSTCNQQNQLVVEIVDIEKPPEKPKENTTITPVVENPNK
jgi:hypothetical protein